MRSISEIRGVSEKRESLFRNVLFLFRYSFQFSCRNFSFYIQSNIQKPPYEKKAGMRVTTTLRDVARLAGVSPATVSRVINGKSQVSDSTRSRVWDAIEKLGYEVAAKRQASKDSEVVALLIPDVISPFFTEIICGVEKEVYEHGLNLALYSTDNRSQPDVLARVANLQNVCGLISVTPHQGKDEDFGRLTQKLPAVVVDYSNDASTLPHISVDNLRGGYAATEYLIQKGHRRIGIITGPLSVQSALERLRGFRLALDEAAIPLQSEWVKDGAFAEQGGYQAVQTIIQSSNTLPTALFCSNDLMAAGALRALREFGLKVPDDVAIIGFDDLPIASLMYPSLTTIAQPIREMGEIATRVLFRLIAGERLETNRIVLDTKLVVRHSA